MDNIFGKLSKMQEKLGCFLHAYHQTFTTCALSLHAASTQPTTPPDLLINLG